MGEGRRGGSGRGRGGEEESRRRRIEVGGRQQVAMWATGIHASSGGSIHVNSGPVVLIRARNKVLEP